MSHMGPPSTRADASHVGPWSTGGDTSRTRGDTSRTGPRSAGDVAVPKRGVMHIKHISVQDCTLERNAAPH